MMNELNSRRQSHAESQVGGYSYQQLTDYFGLHFMTVGRILGTSDDAHSLIEPSNQKPHTNKKGFLREAFLVLSNRRFTLLPAP